MKKANDWEVEELVYELSVKCPHEYCGADLHIQQYDEPCDGDIITCSCCGHKFELGEPA